MQKQEDFVLLFCIFSEEKEISDLNEKRLENL